MSKGQPGRSFPKPDPDRPYERADLLKIFKIIPGGKTKVGKDRNPRSLTVSKEITSPVDSEVKFTIKKATNREDVERANLFARIEYVQSDETGEMVTRREFPGGDLQIRTILLCLIEWNITDESRPVMINQQTLLDYLQPEERVFVYNEILDYNPIWTSGGRESTKSVAD